MDARKARKITSRVSSVTNGFVQAILPDILPDPEEQRQVLDILGIDPDDLICAYCGDPAKHWDHLNAYVRNKRPSGFLNDAYNRVPACGDCNTSKSGKDWQDWITGAAKKSPVARRVAGLDERIEKLRKLEQFTRLLPYQLEELANPEIWADYWAKRTEIEKLMFDAQRQAECIKKQISKAIERLATDKPHADTLA